MLFPGPPQAGKEIYVIRGGLEPVLDKVPVGKFTKFRSIAGCVYTPGGKFSIIEFGLEKAVPWYGTIIIYFSTI